jgi:colanic acid biosynthesis glycosyl transferase WcaI
LAARGHQLLHLYCASTHTPRGELGRRDDDSAGFSITIITLSQTIPEGNVVRRYFLESEYGKKLVARRSPIASNACRLAENSLANL